MIKKLIAMTAGITIGLAALNAAETPESSLKDQIMAVDKELSPLRKTTLADPLVKAAQAEVEIALAKLKAAEDTVLTRTDSHGKELVEKFRKLLEQYKAQQKAENAKVSPKQ